MHRASGSLSAHHTHWQATHTAKDHKCKMSHFKEVPLSLKKKKRDTEAQVIILLSEPRGEGQAVSHLSCWDTSVLLTASGCQTPNPLLGAFAEAFGPLSDEGSFTHLGLCSTPQALPVPGRSFLSLHHSGSLELSH